MTMLRRTSLRCSSWYLVDDGCLNIIWSLPVCVATLWKTSCRVNFNTTNLATAECFKIHWSTIEKLTPIFDEITNNGMSGNVINFSMCGFGSDAGSVMRMCTYVVGTYTFAGVCLVWCHSKKITSKLPHRPQTRRHRTPGLRSTVYSLQSTCTMVNSLYSRPVDRISVKWKWTTENSELYSVDFPWEHHFISPPSLTHLKVESRT